MRAGMSSKAAFADYDGTEYGFPRPVPNEPDGGSRPLVIVGGARQSAAPEYEMYEADDSVMNSRVGDALRGLLPKFFPERYDAPPEAVQEWVSSRCSQVYKNAC